MSSASGLKKRVFGAAKKFGYTIIPNWRLHSYTASEYLQKLFKFLDVDVVFDVGANVGQYYQFLRNEVGYEGLVVSFEPTPNLARVLKEKASREKSWVIEDIALGSENGEFEFNVMENTELNSFRNPKHDDTKLFVDLNVVREKVMVKTRTVDEVYDEITRKYHKKNAYLKIDTQGFDLEVLKGASRSLAAIPALQVEVSVVPIYQNAPVYKDIIDYLEARDFVMSGIFPNNEGHFPRLIEFDLYMINKSRL
jgi:FkbM family methyltransferase